MQLGKYLLQATPGTPTSIFRCNFHSFLFFLFFHFFDIKRGYQQFSRIRRQKQEFSFFFCLLRKTLLVNCFPKWHSKVPASLYFGKKYESSKSAKTYLICIISIGLSVHFHNAPTSQRKIILDSFFHKSFFIPWRSFLTIFHLQLNFFFVCNHPRKVYYIFYSVCTLNFAIFQTTITSGVYECT